MSQKLKTALAIGVLALFALLAVNQLEQSWTQEVHPSMNLTTIQKPYRLQNGKNVVLSRDELRSLNLTVRDSSNGEVLAVALSFKEGAPAIYAIPPLPMVTGDYTVQGTATFKWEELPEFQVKLQGYFTVDTQTNISISLE